MDIMDGVRSFVAVAETQSFTRASERLGISNKLVSKYVGALEARLNLRLFRRTTRALSLTSEGIEYLQSAQELIHSYENFVGTTKGHFHGVLRISSPATMLEDFIVTAVADFQEMQPDVQIELKVTDEKINLARDGYDLALRVGFLSDSALMARRLGSTRIILAASPTYLAKAPDLNAPDDLINHTAIFDTNSPMHMKWRFEDGRGVKSYPVNSPVSVSGIKAARLLAVQGRGLMLAPAIAIRSDLEAGTLVEVMPSHNAQTIPIHLLTLASPIRRPILSMLNEYIQQKYKEIYKQI